MKSVPLSAVEYSRRQQQLLQALTAALSHLQCISDAASLACFSNSSSANEGHEGQNEEQINLPLLLVHVQQEADIAPILKICQQWQLSELPKLSGLTKLHDQTMLSELSERHDQTILSEHSEPPKPHGQPRLPELPIVACYGDRLADNTPMNALVLACAKLNRILDLDPLGRTMRLQCGVSLATITEAAAEFELEFAVAANGPMLSTDCNIGSCLTDSSNWHARNTNLLTCRNILQLKAHSADGAQLVAGSEAAVAPGLDLLPLVAGEACVISEVVVALTPKPQAAYGIFASFDNATAAGMATAAIVDAGIVSTQIVAALRLPPTSAMLASYIRGHAELQQAVVILLNDDVGSQAAVTEQSQQLLAVLQHSGAQHIQHEFSQKQQKQEFEYDSEPKCELKNKNDLRFWHDNDATATTTTAAATSSATVATSVATANMDLHYRCPESTIPQHQLTELLAAISELGAHYQLRCNNVYHMGHSRLYSLIWYDASDATQVRRAELCAAEILQRSSAIDVAHRIDNIGDIGGKVMEAY